MPLLSAFVYTFVPSFLMPVMKTKTYAYTPRVRNADLAKEDLFPSLMLDAVPFILANISQYMSAQSI